MDLASQPDLVLIPSIRSSGQLLATVLIGLLASCGLLVGVFLPRRTDLRAKYRERVEIARTRIRAGQIEPALRALYDDLSREVVAMNLASGEGVPTAAFEAAVAGAAIRLQVDKVSASLAAESHLVSLVTVLIKAQERVLTWTLFLASLTLLGLLGFLLLVFSSWPWELIAASIYGTVLALAFVRLGQLLWIAIGRETELDGHLARIEDGE